MADAVPRKAADARTTGRAGSPSQEEIGNLAIPQVPAQSRGVVRYNHSRNSARRPPF
jgi:hypothetical protein